MLKITQPALATLALMTVLAASPVFAQDTMSKEAMSKDTMAPVEQAVTNSAPETPTIMATKSAKHEHHGMHDIEGHIKHLHEKLKITAEQEGKWETVATTMRDNEKALHALIEERHAGAKTMSAIDDLQSYEKIADEHAEGLKKLIPAFKDLYETMSDAQKKNADMVFGRYEGHPDRKAEHKAMLAK